MTWVKICGTTSIEDARLALEAGADALGFVFAESPRRVTPETVRQVVAELPEDVEKIGVFVGASAKQVVKIVETARLTGVQLHGEKAWRRLTSLRAGLAVTCRKPRLLCVWRLDEFPPTGAYRLDMAAGEERPDALLLDSR
ncbi:MAG: phosphoribosylanthranilate isomerase, partial [Acidobacteria bacterium]|nr:phosphoribosylanthranilate isomerase [Acidobacteriota bacterium]